MIEQKENARELMKKYRTINDIMTSSLDDLAEIPGLGNKRVLSIYQTFQQTKEIQNCSLFFNIQRISSLVRELIFTVFYE